MLELPHLNEIRCMGCTDCARVCPAACLEMSGQLPWLPRPAHCISCGLCVLICPADAIELTGFRRIAGPVLPGSDPA